MTYGVSPDVVDAFAVMEHESMVVDYPENATAMFFFGNGTAYYLQANVTLDSNSYAIMIWNAYNDTQLQMTAQTTTHTFYRSCFSRINFYALDRENDVLIIWPLSSNSQMKVIPLSKNDQWVNTIESISWSYDQYDSHIYALDRNGTVWSIQIETGECDIVLSPKWPGFRSNVAANQLVFSPYTGNIYYLGYDVRIDSYVLVTYDGLESNVVTLHNALHGLQWIGLTMFAPKK